VGDIVGQALEAAAILRAGATLAQILVDHDDTVAGPAELYRSLLERILAVRRLTVLHDLSQRRLS
jgi:hypothetical protein